MHGKSRPRSFYVLCVGGGFIPTPTATRTWWNWRVGGETTSVHPLSMESLLGDTSAAPRKNPWREDWRVCVHVYIWATGDVTFRNFGYVDGD